MHLQRNIVDRQLEPWIKLRQQKRPPCGWLQAVRLSLGLSTKLLAKRLGCGQSSVTRLEKREQLDRVSLKSLKQVAQAMGCELVYAIVPGKKFKSLNDIVGQRTHALARHLALKSQQHMQLEGQGLSNKHLEQQIALLATQLKNVERRLDDLNIEKMWFGSQQQYDAIKQKNDKTLYHVTG